MEKPIWVKGRVPPDFWKNPDNRRRYMQWLGETLGFKKPEDWYRITQKDFRRHSGYGFLKRYQRSPSAAVMEYFPEYKWKEWLFGQAPKNFWNKTENRYRYMKWLGETLGFRNPEDWYKITQKDFERHKGARFLLGYYQGSPSAAVIDYLPDHEWKEWLFGNVPLNFWNKPGNRHRYMQWLGETLGFKNPEDWYRITQKDFHRHNGAGFLGYYQNSPSAAVIEYFPEYKWKEWLFNNAPNNFWNKPDNRRQYMQWLGEILGFKNPEDWYTITAKDFQSNKGDGLLQRYYRGSPSAAVKEYFPDYKWKEWLFDNAPINFWNKPGNRRRYMQWLGEVLGFKKPEDWYKITQKDFDRHKGVRFLSYYQNSPSVAVMDYLPEYEWKEWLFNNAPNNFWNKPDNRRRYMQWLGEKLSFRKPEDWYRVTKKDFESNKGGGFLAGYYQSSPSSAVTAYLPEYEWKEWLFSCTPMNFWNKPENRRRYMKWLGEKLDFRNPEDWYRITVNDFYGNNGSGFLNYYHDSPSAAVMDYLPEYEWKEWFFEPVPQNFWNKPENRHRYMQWFEKTLAFRKPEDWYEITQKDFQSNKGNGFLQCCYQNSPSAAVMEYFPEYEWKEWLFVRAPNDFWDKPENRHRYMQWLGEKLDFRNSEDWYRITAKHFHKYKGHRFLQEYYQGSPSAAVIEYLQEYEWKEWLFDQVPLNFWDEPENRRRYMDWFGEQFGFRKPEDWYRITQKDFHRHKGTGFLGYYQNSPSVAVREYFPEYDWKEWLFDNAPNNFWDEPENSRRYMQWLGEKLGFKKPEDWYKITGKDFHSNNGGGLLASYYQDSPSAAVIEYFPEYEWREWFFETVPQNFWKKPKNRHRYMTWLGEKLGFRKPEDWYRITAKDFHSNNGGGLLASYYQDSPSLAVMAYISDYDWQPEKFSYRKKRQKRLYRIVKRIFSSYDVKWDFKHPQMRFVRTDYRMELDIFIPALNLAFEYQGEQHSLPVEIWGGLPALEECQRRDKEKRKACKEHGITLIEVHYSWDGRENTAIEMLTHQFVKKVKDRVKGTEQIQSALKAINTYCKKKQRKQRKKHSGDSQRNFSFLTP